MALIHLLLLTLYLTTTITNAHNITEILSSFPDYSQFNGYLTQTKLADDINSRQTITVLVLNNAAVSNLTAKHSLPVIKTALSLHVLLDYFDAAKLHQLSRGSTLSTTLYQTTGNAQGHLGFVNITDLRGGRVGFGSGEPGSPLDSTYTKEVKKIPYNISVLEISKPIIVPSLMTESSSASNANITDLLDKAGCKRFATLIEVTGVVKVYNQTAAEKGLTVFAPSDEAFKAQNVPDLSKLTNAEVVSLLQYHAVAGYSPKGTLKTTNHPMDTLATNGAGKFDLTVTAAGDEVTLHTGYDSSRIASIVLDSTPLVIFTVDSVLLPTELFGRAPSTAPAAAPVAVPSLAPVFSAPSSAPVTAKAPASAKAPAIAYSPPAPPMESPVEAPVEGPGPSQSENSKSGSGAGDVKTPTLFKALVTVSATVIVSVFLS